jgi:hypothetical protein
MRLCKEEPNVNGNINTKAEFKPVVIPMMILAKINNYKLGCNYISVPAIPIKSVIMSAYLLLTIVSITDDKKAPKRAPIGREAF